MIHENYGNNLDITTDEEDNYQKQSIDSTPENNSPIQNIKQENDEKLPVGYFYFILQKFCFIFLLIYFSNIF